MKRPLTLGITLLLAPLPARAQAPAPPPLVLTGLKTMVEGRCRVALTTWTSTWPEEAAAGRDRLISGCEELAKFGAVDGYDLVRVVDVTPSLLRIYVVLRYAIQPVYLVLVAYAPDTKTWKINAVQWNTNPDDIFPPGIVPLEHPAVKK